MNHRINAFMTRLSDTMVDGPVTNQYANHDSRPDVDRANAIRRDNLGLYLRWMTAARPWLLLLGEAPGYRGCRLTGIPFTSEAVLLDGRLWRFGPSAGFRKTAERVAVTKEATATMMWSALACIPHPPLLWNAFPFHPYQPGKPASNRKPNKQELLQGAQFVTELIDLLAIEVVAAVGRSAAVALDLIGVRDYHLLRHPSHGGKTAFVTGLNQLLQGHPHP
jgi:uracil-DNA glycosylase